MEQEEIDRVVRSLTGSTALRPRGRVQSLWSGYGSIDRIGLEGTDVPSVIVKLSSPAWADIRAGGIRTFPTAENSSPTKWKPIGTDGSGNGGARPGPDARMYRREGRGG